MDSDSESQIFPGLELLERMVRLYYVVETENVMEHDSPVPGLTRDVKTERFVYEFFRSPDAAQDFVRKRQEHFQGMFPTLRGYGAALVGPASHCFAADFSVSHTVLTRDVPADDLTVVHADLLATPAMHLERSFDMCHGCDGRGRYDPTACPYLGRLL